MTDIFVSYASEDRTKVGTLVKLLEEMGWSVWWDQAIDAGTKWEPAILDKVRAAKCVLVVWSRDSVRKDWVVREAKVAEESGTLLPVLLQPGWLPTPTEQTQALKLSTWQGDPSSALQCVLEAVRAKVGSGKLQNLGLPDKERLQKYADRISRIEVAQVVFDYCALSLKHELRRRSGGLFRETDFEAARESYARLRDVLSDSESSIGGEDLHELIERFGTVLSPESAPKGQKHPPAEG